MFHYGVKNDLYTQYKQRPDFSRMVMVSSATCSVVMEIDIFI